MTRTLYHPTLGIGTLTDDHPAASDGRPVFVLETPFSPCDFPPGFVCAADEVAEWDIAWMAMTYQEQCDAWDGGFGPGMSSLWERLGLPEPPVRRAA